MGEKKIVLEDLQKMTRLMSECFGPSSVAERRLKYRAEAFLCLLAGDTSALELIDGFSAEMLLAVIETEQRILHASHLEQLAEALLKKGPLDLAILVRCLMSLEERFANEDLSVIYRFRQSIRKRMYSAEDWLRVMRVVVTETGKSVSNHPLIRQLLYEKAAQSFLQDEIVES